MNGESEHGGITIGQLLEELRGLVACYKLRGVDIEGWSVSIVDGAERYKAESVALRQAEKTLYVI